jgi:DNA-binding MarR family transcriptional regulator
MKDRLHIAMRLRTAYLALHRQTGARLARHGVTADQFVCLIFLAEQDGITQQQLVRRASSDPNTVRAMLVLLEKRGLVSRDPHPTDGRARRVSITRKGRALLKKLEAAVLPVNERLRRPFPDGDAKMLVRYLDRVIKTMAL